MSLDVDAIMAGLKGFQRDAVEHVADRFYGAGRERGSGRFLVADETGLGKSIVARGVIARTIEQLEHDDSVGRIDIVYICSNVDLAAQNLKRLNVTGAREVEFASRLTLLAAQAGRFANAGASVSGKPVNLISFTPGTSFSTTGNRGGHADERALLALLLEPMLPASADDPERRERALQQMLRGTLRDPRGLEWRVQQLRRRQAIQRDGFSAPIIEEFEALVTARGAGGSCLDDVLACIDEHAPYAFAEDYRQIPDAIRQRATNLIARLRGLLAKASVEALEPDLIILDEFQRFRHLLDAPSGADDDRAKEAADLAHTMFDHGQAKVLLLSATPYKPYTQSAEVDDDHHRDFMQLMRFLSGDDDATVADVRAAFAQHRRALEEHGDSRSTAERVRQLLLPMMSRSERPALETADFVRAHPMRVDAPSSADVGDWLALRELGQRLGSRVDLEHWKSIPYFGMFMGTYASGSKVRDMIDHDPHVRGLLARTRSVTPAEVAASDEIDLGTGTLRALADATARSGWWRLLWMPPSIPYIAPGSVYSEVAGAADGVAAAGDAARDATPGMTKRVVFSAWTGVPRAVTALLSHEATRLRREAYRASTDGAASSSAAADEGTSTNALAWRRDAGSMNSLAMLWPHPALADATDPVRVHRAGLPSALPDAESLAALVVDDVALEPWEAFLRVPGAVPDGVDLRRTLRPLTDPASDEREADADGRSRFAEHVEHARAFLAGETATDEGRSRRLGEAGDLGWLAAHGPGSIAYRALRSLDSRGVREDAAAPGWSETGLWHAAWRLSLALRALFSRPDTRELVHAVYPDATRPYWRLVLEYCADGNLQAVLDEYLFQLWGERGLLPLDDAALLDIAEQAATAMNARPARVEATATTGDREPVGFTTRFALQYANARDGDDGGSMRPAAVRAAFNSPFAPFVLASTSVGQEGIDFHWWSHAVVHWNLPYNPVDFEQREGRVHRFGGHAVRKNVGHRHGRSALASGARSVWTVAFDLAEQDAADRLGEFAPWWIYDGPARIERIVPHYPLSRDEPRYRRLVRDLALYRLTLGQPRQEDLLELLRDDGSGADRASIDLSPPRSGAGDAG